ncbi:MAG: hypothetical protein P4L42_08465 [Desulfocapsaceae bacterium]|nr:hypothetical protein [Desulfocapsaceae bacterium]
MKVLNGRHIAGFLLFAGALVFAVGCGFKNYPVPPESVVPKAIEDLRYSVDEKGVNLTWSYPVQTVRGTDIPEVSSFELYRAVMPVEDYCSGCPIPFGEPQILPGGVTTTETRRQGSYQTSLLRSGHKYFFKVRSRTSWWAASDDSNIVTFIWHTPTKAPQDVKAKAGDRRVMLSWSPVSTYMDGRAVDMPVGYQVLRSQDGQNFEAVGEPVSDTGYVDQKVVIGRKYAYKIQSILLLQGNVVGGGSSEEVAAVPLDLTPPPPPVGVSIIGTGAGIKVYWERSTEPKVAGYRIYRRAANQDTPVRIGETAAEVISFTDSHVPGDVRVYYSVTAIDKATPPNESQHSMEVTLRY